MPLVLSVRCCGCGLEFEDEAERIKRQREEFGENLLCPACRDEVSRGERPSSKNVIKEGKIMPQEVTTIAIPDTTVIKAQADDAIAFAKEVKVADSETYKIAGEFLAGLKAMRGVLKATFYDGVNGERNMGPIPLAHASWKAGLAAFNRHDKPYEEAQELVGKKMEQYYLLAQAKKKAEDVRLQQQTLFKLEEARVDHAAALAQQGRPEEAKAILAAPLPAAPSVSTGPAVPKLEGIAPRKGFDFRVTDEKLIPREYLEVDESKIRGVVLRLGMDAKIPGVEVFEVTNFAGTGR